MAKILENESDRQRMILERLVPGKVLDLGCVDMEGNIKDSLHAFLIRNFKGEVIGVDVQEHELADVVADLNSEFPFEDNYAENIVAGELIEHLADPLRFLRECNRGLKSGGRLVLTTPNATGLQIITGKESDHHYFALSKLNMDKLARDAGFAVEEISYMNVYFKRNVFLRGLGFLVPKLRPVLFVVLRKKIGNSIGDKKKAGVYNGL